MQLIWGLWPFDQEEHSIHGKGSCQIIHKDASSITLGLIAIAKAGTFLEIMLTVILDVNSFRFDFGEWKGRCWPSWEYPTSWSVSQSCLNWMHRRMCHCHQVSEFNKANPTFLQVDGTVNKGKQGSGYAENTQRSHEVKHWKQMGLVWHFHLQWLGDHVG